MSSQTITSRRGALDAVAAELIGEKAATLGRSAARMETALARLAAPQADDDREDLLKAASMAVWHFFIQREVCGLRDHRAVIADYAIPKAVLRRLGAL